MPPRRSNTRLARCAPLAVLAAARLLAGLLAGLLVTLAPPGLAAGPAAAPPTSPGPGARCLACHEALQPGIVSDWRLSRHAAVDVGCDACHGTAHATAQDAARALHPNATTCQRCHELQASQFRRGEHARAWQAVKAIPTYHHFTEGRSGDQTGCAACHRLGLMSPQEAAAVDQGGAHHGRASCDACHTRHLFSPAEAREPEACKSCHGFLQYEAWAGSKHGIRHLLKRAGKLPAGAPAPTCQACHMQNADHAIRVSRTNLALRLPLVSDPLVAADKAVIYQALGALDAAGGNGPRAAAMEAAGLAELDRVDPSEDRARLVNACRQCHATAFVQEQLDGRDAALRRADALVADAIRAVRALYDAKVLPRKGPGPFPDLVAWPTASPVEQKVAAMFFDHRARLMAAAYHMSPEATSWMAVMERDLEEVRQLAAGLRAPKPAR